MKEDEIKECIVKIKINGSHGTGFFIDKNKILTCFHVIKNVNINEVKIVLKGEDYSVEILDKKEDIDLAILKVEVVTDSFLKQDNTSSLKINKTFQAYGFAHDEYLDRGLVPITFEYEGSTDSLMKFKNGQFEEGHSGSPVLDLDTKKVVGILNISRNTDNSLGGYGIPIDKLSLLKYKEQNKNEITETISLKNGKSFYIQLVKVELNDNKTLYVGKYLVTVEEYSFFCKEKRYSLPFGKDSENPKNPIVNISWNNAKEYCKWLSDKNQKFRLLFFKEWIEISKMLNDNSHIWTSQKELIEVDMLNPNNLGLFHFYGNVHEWCYDSNEKIRLAVGGTNISITKPIKKLPSRGYQRIGFRIIMDIT